MWAYYNEHDAYAAEWLRRLILFGHIAPGEVDERSIEDVAPDDVRGFTQCHFFAGIGVWSYALRLAGWSDERPIWTASCPCQPLSAAGKGLGFADERHLWPAFHHLLRIVRPPVVAGEQVASKAADAWVDLVQADVEALGYAFGCVPFPAASVGAPHIRDRNYWLAHHHHPRLEGWRQPGRERAVERAVGPGGVAGGAHDASGARQLTTRIGAEREARNETRLRGPERGCPPSGLADDNQQGSSGRGVQGSRQSDGAGLGATCERSSGLRTDGGLADSIGRQLPVAGRRPERRDGAAAVDAETLSASPTNGFWRDADWLLCRDERWRPVEPGTFPLAHGAPARVGRLRAYGNAIVAEAAKEFMSAVMDCLPC